MKSLFASLDDLLRGRLTRREDLREGRIEVPVRTLVTVGLLLGAAYGVCMGLYAIFRGSESGGMQLLATTLKVPLLFVLTLAVTYPSLYVVSAMFDSKLRHRETLRLLLAAMAVNLALLASFGPVTAFFTASTESYPFMLVLNVVFFVVAGFAGLAFLDRALKAVFEEPSQPARRELELEEPGMGRARPARPRRTASQRVFSFWVLIYGVVGAQMGWVLRPFVGSPNLEFEWFRDERDSNFFEAIGGALLYLLGG